MRSLGSRFALILVVGTGLTGTQAAAQQLPSTYVPAQVVFGEQQRDRLVKPLMASPAPDHRWEGLLIGALVGGALVGGLRYGLCADSGNGSCTAPVIAWALGGMTIGGVTGVFLGSAASRSPQDTTGH